MTCAGDRRQMLAVYDAAKWQRHWALLFFKEAAHHGSDQSLMVHSQLLKGVG